MSEQSFFQNALGNFTFEVASGGAIRHLTDLGYTAKQIYERLDFPTPMERIQNRMWERLLETGVILTDEPGSVRRETADYVREYDRYGKASFRRVVRASAGPTAINWREQSIRYGAGSSPNPPEDLRGLLLKRIADNGEDGSYAACDFARAARLEPERFDRLLQALEREQREYVESFPWKTGRIPSVIYHRLNPRMLEIVLRLCGHMIWEGDCYFLHTQERIHFLLS